MLATPGFGRDRDIAEVLGTLEVPGTLVVSGPAGIGKSHLLRAVGSAWPGEVAWCDLDGATSSVEALARVASSLGLQGDRSPSVADALAGRPGSLLILDNAEEVLAELGDALRDWREHRVLVGSRLRLPDADRVLVLEPLPPEAARALYLERAHRAVRDWEPVPQELDALVAVLDGLPLAVELAAARVRVFPPAKLLERLPEGLSDPRATGRHRSLEAALSVSWDLLAPQARRSLSDLATVRGVFDADAFLEVTGADVGILEDLLDASLVQLVAPGRMRLLETVRAFARGRAEPAEAAAAEARHAQWVEAAADDALSRVAVQDMGAQLDALRVDLAVAAAHSPRAAWLLARVQAERGPLADPGPAPAGAGAELVVAWGLTRSHLLNLLGQHEVALAHLSRLEVSSPADALRRNTQRVLHLIHLRPDEAVTWIPDLLTGLAHGEPADVAEARLAAAIAEALLGHVPEALAHLEEGRHALVGVAQPEVEARLRMYYAMVAQGERLADARVHLEASAELFHRLGRRQREAMALSWCGSLALHHGDLASSRQALERSVELCARYGDRLMRAEVQGHLVELALEEGRLDDAEALQREIRSLDDAPPPLLALTRSREGLLALRRGENRQAVTLLASAGDALEHLGRRSLAVTSRVYQALALGPGSEAEAVLEAAMTHAEALDADHCSLVTLARRGLQGTVEVPAEVGGQAVRMVLSLLQLSPRVHVDGDWVSDRGGQRRSLEAKPVLRRLASALAAAGPGNLLSRTELIERTWPGQRMRADSASGRLHAAVRTLRRLGLRDDLVTSEADGELAYGLSADVVVATS